MKTQEIRDRLFLTRGCLVAAMQNLHDPSLDAEQLETFTGNAIQAAIKELDGAIDLLPEQSLPPLLPI